MGKIVIDKKKIKNIFYKNLLQINDYLEHGMSSYKMLGQLMKDTASLLIYNNPFDTKLPNINDFLPLGLKTNLDYLKIDTDYSNNPDIFSAQYSPTDNSIVFYQENCNNIIFFLVDISHEYTHFIQEQVIEYVIEHPNIKFDEKLNNVVEDSISPLSETSTLCDFIRLYKKLNFQDFDDIYDFFHNEKTSKENYQRIINEGIYYQFYHEEQARDCSYNFMADLYNEMQLDKDCPNELKEIISFYYDDLLIEQNADLEYRKNPSYEKLRKLYHECSEAISKFPVNKIAKIENEILKNDVGNLKLNSLRKNKASGKKIIGTLYALEIEPTPYNNLAVKMIDTQKAYLEFIKTYKKAGEIEIANLFNNSMLNIDTFEKAKFSSNDEILNVCKYWLRNGNYNSLFYIMKIINEVDNPIYSAEVANRIIDFRDTLLSDKKFVNTINKNFSRIESLINGNGQLSETDVKLLKNCKNISYIHKSLLPPAISQKEEESQRQYYYNINTLAQDLVANHEEIIKQSNFENAPQIEAQEENQVSNQES